MCSVQARHFPGAEDVKRILGPVSLKLRIG